VGADAARAAACTSRPPASIVESVLPVRPTVVELELVWDRDNSFGIRLDRGTCQTVTLPPPQDEGLHGALLNTA
jgi:hypothetical protein